MFFIIHTDSHINLKYTICVVISALSVYLFCILRAMNKAQFLVSVHPYLANKSNSVFLK